MRTRILLFLCAAGLVLAAPRRAVAAESDAILNDELTVKSAGLPVDGAGCWSSSGFAPAARSPRTDLAALIEQLGAKDGAVREKAAAELTASARPPSRPCARRPRTPTPPRPPAWRAAV